MDDESKLEIGMLSTIRLGMQQSKLAEANITAAHEACHTWSIALSQPNLQLEPTVQVLCLALYANSLVRIGKDDVAESVYSRALRICAAQMPQATIDELKLGRGRALQRLLRYEDAKRQYLDMQNGSGNASMLEGIVAAATCCLRLGDTDGALDVLNSSSEMLAVRTAQAEADAPAGEPSEGCRRLIAEVQGIRATLALLVADNSEHGNCVVAAEDEIRWKEMVREASECSPQYMWMHHVLTLRDGTRDEEQAQEQGEMKDAGDEGDGDGAAIASAPSLSFLDLIKMNQSPFDDPALLLLDDKVELHRLLTSNDNASRQSAPFWPRGYILPTQMDQIRAMDVKDGLDHGDELWIRKRRSGYGSHGNQIVTLHSVVATEDEKSAGSNIRVRTENKDEHDDEEVLLQKMVHPPMLLDEGRKFSLRIYVVYFGSASSQYSISELGLVKVASESFEVDGKSMADTSRDDAKYHMTNSGREQQMTQHELAYLRDHFIANSLSFDEFWHRIESSIATTMQLFRESTQDASLSHDGNCKQRMQQQGDTFRNLCLPKILGLDFVVDAHQNPWLIEVNRFPGLEPRDDSDMHVKHHVVREAWLQAASLACPEGNQRHPFEQWLRTKPSQPSKSKVKEI